MIFKQWQLVLDGHKTQTRRLWKSNHELGYTVQHQVLYNTLTDRPLIECGQLLPIIPKRTYPAIRIAGEIARVRVKNIRAEYLQDITEADAIAEGVKSVEAYKALWESINGKTKGARWDDNPRVVVITFEMATMAAQEAMN